MYGRARRIALARTIAIIAAVVIVLYFIISSLFTNTAYQEENMNFEYLRDYFLGQGYSCKAIEQSGGSCTLKKNSFKYNFVRYDDGFYYMIDGSSYTITINYLENEKHQIEFKTKATALGDYKKKTYYCTTNGTIVDGLKECVTETGEKLDLQTYIGVVESAIVDVNNILDASGYNKERLLESYIWEK